MDLCIDNTMSCFPFPMPLLSDEEKARMAAFDFDEDGVPRVLGSEARGLAGGKVKDERSTDGSYAQVADAPCTFHSSPRRRKRLVDVPRLVARLWNVMERRSAAGTTAGSCYFRLPPFVLDNRVYNEPFITVSASGTVMVNVYGSVRANLYAARRAREVLIDAYFSPRLMRAAKEERRLLQAVLGEGDTSGAVDVATTGATTARTAKRRREENGVSLAAALAANDLSAIPVSSVRGGVAKGTTAPRTAPAAGGIYTADLWFDGPLRLQQVSAIAYARWPELAGLRESFFDEEVVSSPTTTTTTTTAHSAASPTVVAATDTTDMTSSFARDGDSHGLSASAQENTVRASVPAARTVPVAKARVNVTGDAPLAWWQWFLSAGTTSVNDAPSPSTASAPRPPAPSASAGTATSPHNNDDDAAELPEQTWPSLDIVRDFWSCAGHTNVPGTSPLAHRFVTYMQHKRSMVAHHVLSFQVNRMTRETTLRIELSWNAAAPPTTNAAAAAALRPPQAAAQLRATQLPLPSASALGSRVPADTTHACVAKAETALGNQPAAPAASVAPATHPPHGPVAATTNTTTDAWVTEASAANFFLESTFIAESTMPYGLESTRPSYGVAGGTSSSAPQHDAPPSSFVAGLPVREEQQKVPVLARLVPPPRTARPTPTDATPVAGVRAHADTTTARGERRGTAEVAPIVKEKVICLLFGTGSVNLYGVSEVALRQVCDVLLIPFLVATADVHIPRRT